MCKRVLGSLRLWDREPGFLPVSRRDPIVWLSKGQTDLHRSEILEKETEVANTKQPRDILQDKARIVAFLHEELTASGKEGFALGLSGGVDSAVVATLCTEVVPPESVHALYLYDSHNHPRSKQYARRIAESLGCSFLARNIDVQVRQRGAYAPGIVRLSRVSPVINRLTVRLSRPLYRWLFRDTSFGATLRRNDATSFGGLRGALHRGGAIAIEGGFNARHTVRREILEEYARGKNLLPVGAANKTESMVGWFVKGGIDDLVVEPLLDVFKGEVRRLAVALNIPSEIIRQTPTADMFRGVGDELALGYSYDVLDEALEAIELGHDVESCRGVSRSQFRSIQVLHERSAWKRGNEHRFPKLS